MLDFGAIDKLFVPPNNYADIKKALEEDKVVFITGTKEYGVSDVEIAVSLNTLKCVIKYVTT